MRAWLAGRLAGRGQGLVEYAVILALVAVAVVAVIVLQGHQVANAFRNVANTLQGP
jgi:pilus assembly protein Flp/PilA